MSIDNGPVAKWHHGNATATPSATPGKVTHVDLVPGTTASSLTLKDGGAGGTTMLVLVAPANTATVQVNFHDGVRFSTSIYMALTGTAAVGSVGWYAPI